MQVFLAHVVVDTHDAAFQNGEGTFRCVRMDVTANVFMCAVGYAVVSASVLRTDTLIGPEIVRKDASLLVHKLADSTFQRLAAHIRHNTTANPAMPLDRRKDWRFIGSASALAYALVAGLPRPMP